MTSKIKSRIKGSLWLLQIILCYIHVFSHPALELKLHVRAANMLIATKILNRTGSLSEKAPFYSC